MKLFFLKSLIFVAFFPVALVHAALNFVIGGALAAWLAITLEYNTLKEVLKY
jgi:hypothetical protein